MKQGLVSAVIVNWNAAQVLPACLDSLAAQTYAPIEVIAVDNASTDGSADLLARYPGAQLIQNHANLGFTVPNNTAIAASKGEFVLLLNTDVTLAPDYLSRLVAALREDSRRGSAMGKLLRGDGRRIDSAGHVMYRAAWAVNRGQGEPDGPEWNSAKEVFGACAAAALYRRAMLDDVAPDGDYLDPTFFMYLDDVDLDWRARLRGWSSWYEPAAVAVHHRSASGVRRSWRTQRHILKNRLIMLVKNEAGTGAIRRLPSSQGYTAAKVGKLLVTQPGALIGLLDFLRLLPSALRRRRQIQARRTVPATQLEAWFEPLPAPGLLRKSIAS